MTPTLLLKKMYLARIDSCIWQSVSTNYFGNCYGALADISNALPSFLTVSRKCNYSCVYIFHIIYPEEPTWKLILSQMKMFNIFPDFIQQLSITKIFLSNCIRETVGYLPQNSLWLDRFFCVNLANTNERICLMLGCRGINLNRPAFAQKATIQRSKGII